MPRRRRIRRARREEQVFQGEQFEIQRVTLAIAVFAIAMVSAQFFVTAGYLELPPIIITAPVISNVVATPSYYTATVTWTTDVNATSMVRYTDDERICQFGPCLYKHSTAVSDTSGVTSHSVTLTGLQSQTIHHYMVVSNTTFFGSPTTSYSVSADKSFYTTVPPCTGTLTFDLSPGTVQTGASVTATVGGLSYCSYRDIYVYPGPQCSGTAVCSAGTGSAGTGGSCQFSAPSTAGTSTYYACVDMDGSGAYSSGEIITDSVTTTAPQQNQTNQTQPPQPVCNNGLKETGEQCDGADMGTASCPSGTTGTPRCTLTCTLDTSRCTPTGAVCGNGRIESGEECESNSFGGKTCTSMGFVSGSLRCIDCMVDTGGCMQVPTTGATEAQAAISNAQATITTQQNANRNVTAAITQLNVAISSYNAGLYQQATDQAGTAKSLALSAPELQQPMPVVLIGIGGVIIATGAAMALYLLKFMPRKKAGKGQPAAPSTPEA